MNKIRIIQLITILVFTIILFSCNTDSSNTTLIKFTIINDTKMSIDSLYVSVRGDSAKKNIVNISPSKKATYLLDLSAFNGDGDFKICYWNKNDTLKKYMHFGYFTNGTSNDINQVIRINHDKIEFDYER